MYPNNEFVRLNGIVKYDVNPGAPVPELIIPNLNICTIHLKTREFIIRERNSNKWNAAKKLAITIIVKFYPNCDYLLDMEDETGAIKAEPRDVWQYLWDTLTTRYQKNSAIVEVQALIRTEYDPDKPIIVT